MKNGSLSVSDTKLWQRLLLVGLTGAVPLFIVSLVLIKLSYSSSINFAFQEQRGIAFLRPLEQLFDLFQRYQAAARQTLAGDDSAAQKLADLRQQIDKSMDLLAANYNGDLGQALAFTDAELALRKRDNARLSVLQDYWKTLKTASPAVAAGSETTSQLIASIRTMIAQS